MSSSQIKMVAMWECQWTIELTISLLNEVNYRFLRTVIELLLTCIWFLACYPRCHWFLCMFFSFIFNPKQFHRILSINIFLTFLLDASAKILLYRFYTFSLKCFRSLAHSNVCPKFNENIPSFENIVAATQKQQYASTIIRLVDCFFLSNLQGGKSGKAIVL